MKKYLTYLPFGFVIYSLLFFHTARVQAQENHPLQNESSIWDSDEIIININSPDTVKYKVLDLIDNCVTDDCLELRGNDFTDNFVNASVEGQTYTCNLNEDRMNEIVSYQINSAGTLRITVAKLDSINYSINNYSSIDIENVTRSAHYLTVGDIDNDGMDEIALAYYSLLDNSIIVKLFEADDSKIWETDELEVVYDESMTELDEGISVSIGDFNMDNDKEIAMLWSNKNPALDSIQFNLSIVNYDSAGLTKMDEMVLASIAFYNDTYDFSGFDCEILAAPFLWQHQWNDNVITPRDELAILMETNSIRRDLNDEIEIVNSLQLISFNEDLSGIEISNIQSDTVISANPDNTPIDLAFGRLNDDAYYDLVVYAMNQLKVYSFIEESNDFTEIINEVFNLNFDQPNIQSSDFIQVTDLNADGKFEILVTEGVITGDGNQNGTTAITLNMYEVNEYETGYLLEDLSTTAFEYPNISSISYSIAAGDFDGDRVRYGIPKVYHENEYLQPIVVLSAPPTHFDILNNQVIDLTNCYLGDCGFSSLFEKTRSETREISVEVRSDWAIDSKLTASLEETVTIGTKGKNLSGSLKIEGYVSGKYGESFTKVENSAEELSIKVSAEALKEDMVYATISDYTIYEYPVYIDDSVGGYFTMVVPDNVSKSWFSTKSLKGLDFVDRHEVGNALSYTALDIENNPDIAEFVNPGATQINYTIGPSSKYEWSLEFRDFQENQIRTQTDISYGFGASVEASVSATGRVSGWKLALFKAFLKAISKVELKITAKVEGNYINNSSSVVTHTVKVEEELLLRSNLGGITNQYYGTDYSISPVTYWATNGALVLDYEVKPALSPQGYDPTWWQNNYSSAPDLSFILPWKFDPEKNMKLSSNDQRYFSKDIAITNDGTIERGDTVNFIVRAHNYSFYPIFDDIEVAFYLGDPDHGGYPIYNEDNENIVTMDGMLDRDFNLAEFNWVVPGDLDICHPRIYVVLDPENKFAEIHENNNKAYTIIQLNNRDYNCVSYAEVFPSQAVHSEIVVTGLSDEISDDLGIGLYPNPALNEVSIDFMLKESGPVAINLNDLNGKLIKTILNDSMSQGEHSNLLSTVNLKEGVYLMNFQFDGRSLTKKLIITK